MDTNIVENQLTSCRWVPEKPPVIQLLKNYLTFYGTWRFMFTWALSWAIWRQSVQPHPRSLTSHLFLGYCNGPWMLSSSLPWENRSWTIQILCPEDRDRLLLLQSLYPPTTLKSHIPKSHTKSYWRENSDHSWLVPRLFNNASSSSDYTAIHVWMIPKKLIQKDMKWSGHGLILKYYPSIGWRDWEKPHTG